MTVKLKIQRRGTLSKSSVFFSRNSFKKNCFQLLKFCGKTSINQKESGAALARLRVGDQKYLFPSGTESTSVEMQNKLKIHCYKCMEMVSLPWPSITTLPRENVTSVSLLIMTTDIGLGNS